MTYTCSYIPFVAAISITSDREELFDFLPSYFESGLKVGRAADEKPRLPDFSHFNSRLSQSPSWIRTLLLDSRAAIFRHWSFVLTPILCVGYGERQSGHADSHASCFRSYCVHLGKSLLQTESSDMFRMDTVLGKLMQKGRKVGCFFNFNSRPIAQHWMVALQILLRLHRTSCAHSAFQLARDNSYCPTHLA